MVDGFIGPASSTRNAGYQFFDIEHSFKISVEPTTEPVSISDIRTHIRIDHTEEDSILLGYLLAARSQLERDTRRALISQTWVLRMDRFPEWDVYLSPCPVASVSSITYVDVDGATQTLSSSLYRVDATSEPARIEPAWGETWPSTRSVSNAVTITFTAGYGAETSVPQLAKQAIRMLVAHWYMNREAVDVRGMSIPLGYEAIVDRLRWSGYR